MEGSSGQHEYAGVKNSRSQRTLSKLGIHFKKKEREILRKVWKELEEEKIITKKI